MGHRAVSGTEALLTKALELCTYINTISASYGDDGKGKKKLVLSFDLYCLLLEYTFYLKGLSDTNPNTIEELIVCDDLLFETPNRQLEVNVDFFLPANTVIVR
ncbi:MAG TPA: hypothetical protein VMF88_01960 [Bacteroidota bacterium]|nr:hypothetical protein [Bacteroidota bacterium]